MTLSTFIIIVIVCIVGSILLTRHIGMWAVSGRLPFLRTRRFICRHFGHLFEYNDDENCLVCKRCGELKDL